MNKKGLHKDLEDRMRLLANHLIDKFLEDKKNNGLLMFRKKGDIVIIGPYKFKVIG